MHVDIAILDIAFATLQNFSIGLDSTLQHFCIGLINHKYSGT